MIIISLPSNQAKVRVVVIGIKEITPVLVTILRIQDQEIEEEIEMETKEETKEETVQEHEHLQVVKISSHNVQNLFQDTRKTVAAFKKLLLTEDCLLNYAQPLVEKTTTQLFVEMQQYAITELKIVACLLRRATGERIVNVQELVKIAVKIVKILRKEKLLITSKVLLLVVPPVVVDVKTQIKTVMLGMHHINNTDVRTSTLEMERPWLTYAVKLAIFLVWIQMLMEEEGTMEATKVATKVATEVGTKEETKVEIVVDAQTHSNSVIGSCKILISQIVITSSLMVNH